jgi:multidrug resistance efflux pump
MKDEANNRHRLRRFYLRHAVPVTVWLVAVGVVVWLFHERMQRFEALGIARGQGRLVAATCTGRIVRIPEDVALFQPVKKDQTLVVLDTVADNERVDEAKVRAELAAAGAEVEYLSAQLIPTQQQLRVETARLQDNRQDNWRRFEVDVDSAQLRILDLQATLAADRVTLDDLAMQVKIGRKLLEENAIVPYEWERIKTQHESVARKIQENERLLEQAKVALQQAQQRRDAFRAQELPVPSEDAALEAIHKQIQVQEKVMNGLLDQLAAWKSRREVKLTSPIDGIIIPIHGQRNDTVLQRPGEEVVRRPGEVVRAGDPILAVAEAEPTEVVAYVTEQQLGHLRDRMEVELVKTSLPPQVAASKIVDIGPTVELIPQRLWRNPNVPQWGLPVLVEIPPGLKLVPGEVVGIRGL